MRGQLTLESDSQFAKARKPAMRAFHDPAVFAQPLAAFNAFSRNATGDATPPQVVPASPVVVPFVGMQFVRSPTRSAAQSFDGWQCIQALLEEHRVMPIRSAYQDNKGHTSSIYDDVSFGAEFASICGVGACFRAPRGLETDEPSMLARPQSI